MKTYEQEYIQHQSTIEVKPETPPKSCEASAKQEGKPAQHSPLPHKHALSYSERQEVNSLTESAQYDLESVLFTLVWQREKAKEHADALAEALRWIKEVVSERKGTAMWAQMVEDKARNALRELEKARQQ